MQTTHNSSFQQSDKDQHVCVTDVDWHACVTHIEQCAWVTDKDQPTCVTDIDWHTCLTEERKTSKKLKVSGNVEGGGLALGETLS